MLNLPSLPLLRTELRAYWRLAWPIVIAQLSFIGMGTVDTMLAGHLGEQALAAVAVGSNIFFLSFVFFMGLFMAVSPMVAQAIGRGAAAEAIGARLRAVLLLAIVAGLLWAAFIYGTRAPILDLLGLDAQTYTYADGYLRAIAWAAVPFCLSFTLRNAADAHGLTRVALIVAAITLLFNGVLAYVLMYGRFGLPALGPAGTGYATSISGYLMVLLYLWLYRHHAPLRALHLLQARALPMLSVARELLRVGGATAAILTAEASLFQIGALIVARFGAQAMAAHQVAINFASLAFMVPMSIGMAATVRVGHAAGAGDQAGVALRGRVGILLGAGFALCSASLMLGAPQWIVAAYTDQQAVAQLAVRFLMFAAVFQIFDCIQATANGALRGIKDTRLPMLITVAAYWVLAMPLALWLSFRTPLGPLGVWSGFIAGLAVAAVGLSYRFLSHTGPASGKY
ncbi:multidrug resistance protein, MATE family [Solimonas aquatica]|uniref:Multidrug-efflux transporter n=1 Tax=Solimonas aquatica TaxID=489703 RepID=A0A1H9LUP5_9GAMM|nr:MATE family efflux transporter [Solimonas aquatica]SER14979.1 multidrug resistance protein, MATE family [Solimonas aquatica]